MFFDLISLFWWAGILLVIILVVKHHDNKKDAPPQNPLDRDQLWLNYLASFRETVKTKQEKQLLETLIAGHSANELYVLPEVQSAVFNEPIQLAEPQTVLQEPVYTNVATREPVNNSILLLYFGAFLLVAAIGLFVSLGSINGLARTIIVAVTSLVLYSGGIWLAKTNKKLEQAGVSFVGTGLIIAPFTGVAWYNLVSNQMHGGLIWLVTSIACLALYVHAMNAIKNSFISYLLIGSFVSSILSTILALSLPAYGYAWGLVVAGLLLAVITRFKGYSIEFNKSSDVSAQLLAPLSVLGSIALLPEHGSIQLSVTLLLASVYYGLLAWWSSNQRVTYMLTAQLSFISAIASGAYATNDTISAVGIALTYVAALYVSAAALLSYDRINRYSVNTIGSITVAAATLLSLANAWALVAALGVAIGLTAALWLRLKSSPSLQLGGILVSILPFVVGQYALEIDFNSLEQLMMSVVSTVILLSLVVICSRIESFKRYYAAASGLLIIAIGLLLIPAIALGFTATSVVIISTCLIFVGLRITADDSNWLVGSSLLTLVPFIYALTTAGKDDITFGVSAFAALAWSIGVSLATRQAVVRWVVLICMLMSPLALGGGGFGLTWHAAGYSLGYFLVMMSCVLARAIARGKLLLSLKVPISSYYTYASQAYIVGYVLAGCLAIIISLNAANSQGVTTLLLLGISVVIPFIAYVERNMQLLAISPILMQGILFSAVRPNLDDVTAVGVVAALSTILGIGSYLSASLVVTDGQKTTIRAIRLVSVCTAYIGPAMAITQDHTMSILLPLSLITASALTLRYNRASTQESQELSLIGGIIGLHWLLLIAGVTNIHIHTHVLAAVLLGFAMWHQARGDKNGAINYGKTIFFVVTVPLALQSLGASGSEYGILLIVEQVLFMIIGSTFGIRFLLTWGLWAALAAVLFQLRGLGWAFLTLLAVIIIGVAVYRLQKHDDPPQNPAT